MTGVLGVKEKVVSSSARRLSVHLQERRRHLVHPINLIGWECFAWFVGVIFSAMVTGFGHEFVHLFLLDISKFFPL